MPNRTYSEEEVAALFRRAAEIQSSREGGGVPTSDPAGLSLDELTAIAAEAGLDPQHLRIAAAEMDRSGRTRRAKTIATSSEIVAERWIAGHLSEDAREDIIAELRHRFDPSAAESMWTGGSGKSSVQTLGRSIEWQHTNLWYGTQTRVLIQARDEGVRLRVARSNAYSGMSTGWSGMYGPMVALFAGFIAAPAAGSWLIGIAVAVAALIVLTPLFSTISRRVADSQRSEVEAVADSIESHVRTSAAGQLDDTIRGGGQAKEAFVAPELDGDADEARQQYRTRVR